MMANSHLGLMQLQHKSEDSVPLPFPDFVNVNEQNPLSTALAVNNTSNIPSHVSGNGGGGGPIKRKRGRPRKYTLGPFPTASSMKLSNSPTHDRSRLSLPSQFTGNGEASPPSATYSALSNSIHTNAVTDSLMKSVKQVKTKIGQKINYPSMVPMPATNGHTSIEEKSAGIDQSKITTTNSLNPLLAVSQMDTNSSESNPSMSSSMFRYPVVPTVLSTSAIYEQNISTTKSYNNVKAHQNHNLTSGYNSPRNSSLPTSCNTSLPYFVDPFFQQSVSASMSAVTSPTSSCTFEANLVGRVLPQAEAAICAAKAAGLSGPHTWTPEMVAAFILTLPGCQGLAQVFIEHEIDGTALLCLEQHDLTTIMKLKLGPAVKIFGAIRVLRRTMMSIPYTDFSADHASALTAAITCFPPVSSSSRLDKLSTKQQHPVKNHHHHHNNNNNHQQQQQPGAPAYLAKKLTNQVPSPSESPAGIPTGIDLTPNTASPYHASPASSPHVNGVENQSMKSID